MRITLSDHFTYQKLLRFTMPSIVMMIITSVYSIVDGFFVSNCVGKNAFAALNLIFPVLMALSAFGFMVGTGGSALIAKTLGEGKTKEANGIFSMLVAILAVGGAVLAAVFFVFIRPISYAVGATELTIDDCVLYGRILLVSLPLFMLQNSFQSFLATAEKPGFGLKVTVFAGLDERGARLPARLCPSVRPCGRGARHRPFAGGRRGHSARLLPARERHAAAARTAVL